MAETLTTIHGEDANIEVRRDDGVVWLVFKVKDGDGTTISFAMEPADAIDVAAALTLACREEGMKR